ncbi:unnamed protein product [Adineta steineri]|uniref:Uncharacterized protein n=1 Tax=Adineta steineri TaxID=433720 RepID=A0A813SIB2_9BILA|nr:unnamed protein product [Adineta steineri]CAF0795967.1 unnamed protein product [Adineta steineri]
MHIVFHLLLIIALLGIVVHAQGARGGGGTRSGSSSSSRYRSSIRNESRCQGASCQRTGIIAGSVIGSVLALIAIIFLIIYCYRKYRSRPSQSNLAFVSQNSTNEQNRTYQTYEENCFKNGIWRGRYYQYGRWHEPHKIILSFDRKSDRVFGHGYDDVGKFTIDGTFSMETQRIVITKVYESGTGDSQENFGHTVTLQLTWNSSHAQFEGKWSVETGRYRGSDKFELKLEDSSEGLHEKTVD